MSSLLASWSLGTAALSYARDSLKTGNRAQSGKLSALSGPRDVFEEQDSRTIGKHTGATWRERATFEDDAKAVGFSKGNEAVDIAGQPANWQAAADQQFWKLIVSPEFGERASSAVSPSTSTRVCCTSGKFDGQPARNPSAGHTLEDGIFGALSKVL